MIVLPDLGANSQPLLNVSDAKYLKSQDKRRGRPLVSRKHVDVSERSSGRDRPSLPSPLRLIAVVTSVSSTPAVIRPSVYGSRAASVPLDLSLPRFAAPVVRAEPSLRRWVHEYDTPASPVTLSSPSVMSLLTPSVSRTSRLSPGTEIRNSQSVHVDLIMLASPPAPARVQQFIQTCSPATATITLSVAASTQISPNRVRSDCTPGTVDSGLLFQVSPDST